MSSKDDDFTNNIRRELDESVERLDGETLSKLNRARQTAIESAGRPKSWFKPAAGIAVAASVTILTINLWSTAAVYSPEMDIIEDMELLSNSEELEFYENLEFYQWLEDEEPVT